MIIKVLIVFFIVYFLIFIHEFGHYLAAIRNGVRVDEFSIGFPPKLISFKKGGTRFSFALLPLGGYVKLHGDNAETGSDAKITKSKAFYAKTPWQKIKILLAGVLMNFLVYAILMTGAYTLGVPRFIQSFDVLLSEINDRNIVVEQGLKITDVVEGSEADGKVQLSDRVLYAEKEFFIPSLDLEFENLSDLNDFGVNLNNFFLLPSLRSLNDSNFFKEGDKILAVNGKYFSSYSEFERMLGTAKIAGLELKVLSGDQERNIIFDSLYTGYLVTDVLKDSVAEDFGVKRDFVLTHINDSSVFEIENFRAYVQSLDMEAIVYTFSSLNSDESFSLELKPDSNGVTGMNLSPIYSDVNLGSNFVIDSTLYSVKEISDVKLGLFEAVSKTFSEGFTLTWNIMKSFVGTIVGFFVNFEVSEEVGGPVAVFKMSYDYVSIGGTQLMQFVALISLTLAAINLIPIPVLDGGRIMMVLIEAISGRLISSRVVSIVALVSFVLLMFFVLFVSFFDIIRL